MLKTNVFPQYKINDPIKCFFCIQRKAMVTTGLFKNSYVPNKKEEEGVGPSDKSPPTTTSKNL